MNCRPIEPVTLEPLPRHALQPFGLDALVLAGWRYREPFGAPSQAPRTLLLLDAPQRWPLTRDVARHAQRVGLLAGPLSLADPEQLAFLCRVDPLVAALINQQSPPATLWLARAAAQLVQASALLTQPAPQPDELNALAGVAAVCPLHADGAQPLAPAAQLLTLLAWLDAQMAPQSGALHPDAPDCLPTLQMVYDEIDTALLVVRAAGDLVGVDWAAVRARWGGAYSRILVTTLPQMRLLAQSEMALSLAIGRFRQAWGAELPAAHAPARYWVLQQAARSVARLTVDVLPQIYLAQSDDALGARVHDLQNQLLKVHFRHELLLMQAWLPATRRPLPRLRIDRTLPAAVRIEGLAEHLHDWVALYRELLDHPDFVVERQNAERM